MIKNLFKKNISINDDVWNRMCWLNGFCDLHPRYAKNYKDENYYDVMQPVLDDDDLEL